MSYPNLPNISRSEQLANFLEANIDSKFPKGIEGHWRSQKDVPSQENVIASKRLAREPESEPSLPWPVAYFDIDGYDILFFLSKLAMKEKTAELHNYRGFSIHRLTGKVNGIGEYESSGWRWPEGYRSYIEMGVPPSRAFHRFITGIDIVGLPRYGHEE